jgi:hypothetical protein
MEWNFRTVDIGENTAKESDMSNTSTEISSVITLGLGARAKWYDLTVKWYDGKKSPKPV